MITIPNRLMLVRTVETIFQVISWLIFVRIIFSFLPLGRDANPTLLKIRRLAFDLTEPILAPFRSIIKPVHTGGGGYLDLSPLIAYFVLDLVRRGLVRLLFGL